MDQANAINLTGTEMRAFVEALSASFSVHRLKQMLRFRLEKDLDEISLAEDKITLIFEVVDAARKEGWTASLLAASRASQPTNPRLLAFATSLGLDSVGPVDRYRLEKIVRQRSRFVDFARFRERSALLEACVCSVESPARAGTGFLVAPNLVLTNYHVVEEAIRGAASPKDIRCRFDFLALPDGRTVETGRIVSLAPKWRLADRPYSQADLVATGGTWDASELDYALLQLSEPVGEQPLGSHQAEPGASHRGWIRLPVSPVAVETGDTLIIVQHPLDLEARPAIRQLPMQLAIGEVIEFAGDGIRLRHAATTLPGSSGSPCCTANLDLVALHHAGDPRDWPAYRGEYNQAIPIGLIVKDLQAQGIETPRDKELAVLEKKCSPEKSLEAVEMGDDDFAPLAGSVEAMTQDQRRGSSEGQRSVSPGSRSISIGGNATDSVIVMGDRNKVAANIKAVRYSPVESVEYAISIKSELASIRAIIEQHGPGQAGEIGLALDDATEEVSRESPDRDEVGQALQRALQSAEKAKGFSEGIGNLAPHVRNTVLWLGDNWSRLLAYVTPT
ncbi:trypsin-like peptidase domain-containing protein [Mesorhizobium sp. M0895]|uniref:trypsin-like peptidase domain-containing protein n=1 Tax=Mesorhizobium sp. M0895 TaxID=2957019 RepID=UPI00333862EF